MATNRRQFLQAASIAASSLLLPQIGRAVGNRSQINLLQLVYSGGNWNPRQTALRRLAWEIHKRTAVEVALEPSDSAPNLSALAESPFAYLSGDRGFRKWPKSAQSALSRYLNLGGTLLIDPAFPSGEPSAEFEASVDELLAKVLPGVSPTAISSSHVLFRSFYDIARPVGRVEGPKSLRGYELGDRLAVIRTAHDLGGAFAKDNLGSFEFEVVPGGARQRERAFRLGVNIVLYALLQTYKDEQPHVRFRLKKRSGT